MWSQDNNLPYGYFSLVRHLLLDSDLFYISLKFSSLTPGKVDLTSDSDRPSASLCYALIAFSLSRNEFHWQRGPLYTQGREISLWYNFRHSQKISTLKHYMDANCTIIISI